MNERRGFTGSVLRPEGFVVGFHEEKFADELRFTRVEFDQKLSKVLSQPLKSVLASLLRPEGGYGPLDYYLVAEEMLRLMPTDEACVLLNTEYACSFDLLLDQGQNQYRFLVPRTLYSLLENIRYWMAQPDLGRLDIVPVPMLSSDMLKKAGTTIQDYKPSMEASGLDPFRVETMFPTASA